MIARIGFATLSVCALLPSAHAESTAPVLPPLQEGVVIEFTVAWPDPLRPVLQGQTNLPEGTLLEVYADPAESVAAQVEAGTFSATLGGNGGLSPGGEYQVSVHMLLPMSQPPEVISVIGEDGEHLKGDPNTDTLLVQIDAPPASR